MSSKFKVVITDHRFASVDIQRRVLAEIGAELVEGQAKTDDEIIAIARDADGILNARSKISAKAIEALERCKIMVRYGVGVDTIDIPAATRKGIMVSNVVDYCMDEVSDHAFALLLTLARKVVFSARRVQTGEWTINNLKPLKRLAGQTVGVVGFGRIGRALGRKAAAVGFKVLAFDPFVAGEGEEKDGVTFVSLEQLLKASDFVSLHLPLTQDTRRMIGRPQLERMKSGAYLVNTSRGELVDEEALYRALERSRIAGAACDVFTQEPPERHPLVELDNFILTPHIGAHTREAVLRTAHRATRNLIEMLEGGRERGKPIDS